MDQSNELEEFLERVRSLLGPNPPAVGAGEVEAILELARVAAHSSERRAAPVTTYLAGLPTLVVEEPEWRRIDPDGRSFADLDDPADLAAWDPGPR